MALSLSPSRERTRSQPTGVRLAHTAVPWLRLVLVALLAALGFVALVSSARGDDLGVAEPTASWSSDVAAAPADA